jgi:hypothetical protein
VSAVAYHRAQHAAHYMFGDLRIGHDLESWTVASNTRTPADARTFAGAELPCDAEYHHGFVSNGVQHWVFVRIAPLTGDLCARCAEVS